VEKQKIYEPRHFLAFCHRSELETKVALVVDSTTHVYAHSPVLYRDLLWNSEELNPDIEHQFYSIFLHGLLEAFVHG